MINHRNVCITIGLAMVFLLPLACTSPDNNALQAQVDRLQKRLDSAYAPGLGEFMSGIQVHHEKLWFAGQAANWPLANFEVGEIRETMGDIQRFCQERPEVASLPMIFPALDSLDAAVKSQNGTAFNSSFMLLTNTCNNCHRATEHAFNVIQVPTTPPFSNQVFAKQP